MAGAAVGAASAAGRSAGLAVPDHAAHDQPEQRRDREDQHNIDQICREPREHGITSFENLLEYLPLEKGNERRYLTVSFWDSL